MVPTSVLVLVPSFPFLDLLLTGELADSGARSLSLGAHSGLVTPLPPPQCNPLLSQ